ncbi:fluoride efflux transporter CrcB [Candidatus Bathyarchaeota archaeon]|nr:fluoride efflux transporter CrcB [Candidatus Bathyarchaeota archaeon]
MLSSLIYVGIGGFIGAIFRFLLSTIIQGSTRFPLGTLGVNIMGAFTLSFITYAGENTLQLPISSRLFLTVGLLGAFTTMSTFSLESFKLLEENHNVLFIANLVLNNILCLIGIYLGKVVSSII